jgi:hypothetical protein
MVVQTKHGMYNQHEPTSCDFGFAKCVFSNQHGDFKGYFMMIDQQIWGSSIFRQTHPRLSKTWFLRINV